jgi:hypothetical protein
MRAGGGFPNLKNHCHTGCCTVSFCSLPLEPDAHNDKQDLHLTWLRRSGDASCNADSLLVRLPL